MLKIDEIRERLRDRRLTVVADETGLAYDTVRRVAAGKFTNISYETVARLSDYLEKNA
jgi:DNA-binding Xre family transcriptional regulator